MFHKHEKKSDKNEYRHVTLLKTLEMWGLEKINKSANPIISDCLLFI